MEHRSFEGKRFDADVVLKEAKNQLAMANSVG